MLKTNLGYGAVYAGVGFGLLVLGFYVLDLLTPGSLREKIFIDRSASAALVSVANTLGLGAILFTAIWTNATSGFGEALKWTVCFGAMGIGLLAASFFVWDKITPGKLGDIVCEPGGVSPAAALVAAAQLSAAFVIVASIA